MIYYSYESIFLFKFLIMSDTANLFNRVSHVLESNTIKNLMEENRKLKNKDILYGKKVLIKEHLRNGGTITQPEVNGVLIKTSDHAGLILIKSSSGNLSLINVYYDYFEFTDDEMIRFYDSII